MSSYQAPQVPQIDVHEAARRTAAGEVLLLDVREADEWATGRAPGASHLALTELRAGAVPTDRPVLALCRSGGRSSQAADLLAAAGINVSNVAGGMLAWQAAGLPVIGDGGSPGVVA